MRPIEPTDELWARIEALITALNKRGEHYVAKLRSAGQELLTTEDRAELDRIVETVRSALAQP